MEAKIHHPDDPRRLAREALQAGDVEQAKAWGLLALAEAVHRTAKVIDKDEDIGRHLRPVGFDGDAA